MATTTAKALSLPFDEAIAFFGQKTNITTQHWTDVWRDGHSRGFMVAGAASKALVADFRSEIARALDDGTTLADFRKSFDAIVTKHGWDYNGTPGWRSRVIYETNLATAYSAGRYSQMTEPDTLAAFPFWQYVHSGSQHPRLNHLAWNGLTLRADDPFWATHYPPNGWRCGCRVRPVSRRDLTRMGKERPDRAPDPDPRPWRNPNTGEIHQVPKGIDPGFDYNPGAAWKGGKVSLPADAATPLPAAPPARALPPEPTLPTRPVAPRAADTDVVSVQPAVPERLISIPPPPATPDAVAAFAETPRGKLALGEMPEAARTALRSRTGVVQLSAETVEKQAWRHAELTAADYRAIPALTTDPHLVMQWPGDRVALLRGIKGAPKTGRGSVAHIAIVKATENGVENYLVSVHRLRRKSLKQALRRGTKLAGDAEQLG